VWRAQKKISNLRLFKFEPTAFKFSTSVSHQPFLSSNGSNITSFLFTLSQNYENNFAKLRSDLAQCVGSLISVSTPPDPSTQGNLRLKFFDRDGHSYWAEEVSEGVLYFLALLCIVHQPDPPKLLLLEEPEKGIHPRRIREVMDFVFELARLRDIQIILTSHSPYVVDHFKGIPECISVFDRENGETKIRNAADIIREKNEEYAAQGLPPTNYTDSLGEYWVSGFLGGVPL
jgi:predicted ATPase